MTLSPAARELLLDSEATLRLAGAAAADAVGLPAIQRLEESDLALRVCSEIEAIMSRLREQRGLAALDATAVLAEIEVRLDLLTQMLDPQACDS